jgi:ferritin-like metal-binding protein YciE
MALAIDGATGDAAPFASGAIGAPPRPGLSDDLPGAPQAPEHDLRLCDEHRIVASSKAYQGDQMMKLDSLQKLYIGELRDLYNAENQILKALPKMAKAASAPELQDAFQRHLKETKNQVTRLETIFGKLGESPKGKTCKAMKGLVEEGEELMKEAAAPEILDAGLIAAAQRVEHYEMAGYGTVRTYARLLKENDAERLLQETLDEEGQTDKKLTQLAESLINREALAAAEK